MAEMMLRKVRRLVLMQGGKGHGVGKPGIGVGNTRWPAHRAGITVQQQRGVQKYSTPTPKLEADHKAPQFSWWVVCNGLNGCESKSGAMTCHDRDLQTPWLDSSRAGLTARRCARMGGYLPRLDSIVVGGWVVWLSSC